jgi:ATP-dependent DNA helicase RecG
LQVSMQTRRQRFQTNARALPCSGTNELIKKFLARLGFRLTAAQTRVLREIRGDMGGAHPMRRLLQGDVGCGKTVVAACAALMAIESGFDVILMAPTEILAEQHWRTFNKWFGPQGVTVHLRTSGHNTVDDKSAGESQPHLLASTRGSPALFIGTHAVLEETFVVPKPGLVIIDEQHKFGVAQRERLVKKGVFPHLLVMTATPIPRTLGLVLYGDLDVSVIDELPPGRGNVKTFVRTTESLPKVWEFVRTKLREGRQAYIVYPRLEEADAAAGIKAVTTEFERLKQALAPHTIDLLHARLPPRQQQRVVDGFRRNEISTLLATSVVEVGVDVANATVMVIENAELFGLAQLHQLRGRIGRGAHESYCILIGDAKSPEARQRLKVLADTNDGFRIAEEDLKLRGPGELLGREQSGAPPLRFGDLARDFVLVLAARDAVQETLIRK